MLPLDQEAFESDLASDDFQDGVVRGKWGLLVDIDANGVHTPMAWPHVVIWIRAAERPKSPDRYFFFFTLDGYPKEAPTAHCWDPVTRLKLVPLKWPSSRDPEELTFRVNWEWQAGKGKYDALYAPWDRRGLSTHSNWIKEFPNVAWESKHTIVHYLERSYELLNLKSYRGANEAANP
jgi:hypothetical protein